MTNRVYSSASNMASSLSRITLFEWKRVRIVWQVVKGYLGGVGANEDILLRIKLPPHPDSPRASALRTSKKRMQRKRHLLGFYAKKQKDQQYCTCFIGRSNRLLFSVQFSCLDSFRSGIWFEQTKNFFRINTLL